MENTDKSADTNAPRREPRNWWGIRLVRYAKSKVDERAAKKQKETPADKAARVTANATLWIAIFTLVSVAVSVGTFLILKSQLMEMHDGGIDTHNLAVAAKEQADLQREQLEGTMAAVLTLNEPRITTDPIYANKQILVMQVLNSGHVIAPVAHLACQIDILSFPKLNTLYQSQNCTETIQEVGTSGWSRRYQLPGFSPQEREFSTQKKTVRVQGNFGFDNGFGRKIPPQDFCLTYIGSYNVKNENGGGSTSFGAGFMPCDEFKNRLAYFLAHPWK